MAATPAGRCLRRGSLALAAVSLAGAAALLHAQTANPFLGNWRATFRVATNTGMMDERQADIVITATGGTWHARAQSRQDPCAGKEVPLAIDEVTDTKLTATVRYSTLGDFCKDGKLELQRDADGKVTGKRGRWDLTLERK